MQINNAENRELLSLWFRVRLLTVVRHYFTIHMLDVAFGSYYVILQRNTAILWTAEMTKKRFFKQLDVAMTQLFPELLVFNNELANA